MRTARIPLETKPWRGAAAQLGSPRLTLALMALLAVCVIAVSRDFGPPAWILATPLALLAVNLAGALSTQPAFRTHSALLLFHLALLAVVALAAAGRLTYLKGAVELSEGEEFGGVLTQRESGPLHGDVIERVAFTNLGFTVYYEPGMKRAQTRNRVAFVDSSGAHREAVIGDDTPLKLSGYRFYTTPNKGFAPDFVWAPALGGPPVRGTIHLPSFPAQLTRQEIEWTPPGAAQALLTRLEIEERIVDLEKSWLLRPPREHALIIAAGREHVVLRPGESHRFSEGTLHYAGLRLWMGYSVFCDWTLPWLLAACALAAGALGWHYVVRFRREPWQSADPGPLACP
ncbi:MAG: cytochrome c biogenesis protein ResB [Betaproteobacteria bacterium]|nr:cytochrome c biogenesis protein ResB [Betaproteobacteria bacterium]